jgi:hypothetical protein
MWAQHLWKYEWYVKVVLGGSYKLLLGQASETYMFFETSLKYDAM